MQHSDSIDDIDAMIADMDRHGGRSRTNAFRSTSMMTVDKYDDRSANNIDDDADINDRQFQSRDRSAASAINANDMSSFGFAREKPFTYEEERKLDDVDKQVLEFMAARMTMLNDVPSIVGSNENLANPSTRDTFGAFATPQPGHRGRATQAFLSPQPRMSAAHHRMSVIDTSKALPSDWSVKFEGGSLKPLESPSVIDEPADVRQDTWIDVIERKLRDDGGQSISKASIDKEKVMQLAYHRTRGSTQRDVNRQVGMIASIMQKKAKDDRSKKVVQVADKQLLDIFDEKERSIIKAIRRPKIKTFQSVFEKDAWMSSGLPPVLFGKAQKIFDLIKGQYTGKLTSFAISPDCRSLYVVGTDTGDVIEVDIVKRTTKKEKLGKRVNSLDISKDNQLWAAVLENGDIYVKKTFGSWLSKKMFMENLPLIFVRFIDNDTMIVATERSVLRCAVKNLKVMLDITKEYIFQHSSDPVTNIVVVPTGALSTLIVSTPRRVTLYLLSSPIEKMFAVDRPDYIAKGSLPSIGWLSPEDKSFHYLLICWADYVFLYKVEGPSCLICGMKQLSKRIDWCCVLRNRTILLTMSDDTTSIDSVQSMFANFDDGIGFDRSFSMTDKRYTIDRSIDVDDTISISYSESVKCYNNTIFMIRHDSIANVYLMSFDDLSTVYKDRDEWILALKLCVEVINGKIKANHDEVCMMKDVIKSTIVAYLDKKMTKTVSVDSTHLKALKNSIDAMIATDNLEFMFTTVRQRFEPIVFWREIESFIEEGAIESIPLNLMPEAAAYLSADVTQHLVYKVPDKDLLTESNRLTGLVDVLKRRKMWQSLYRIALVMYSSQMSGVLTSMLTDLMCYDDSTNSLLRQCNDADKIFALSSSPTVMSYMRMFWFLKVIVNWNVGLMLTNFGHMEDIWIKAVEWLMDPSSIKVLMSVNANMYLETYFDLFLNVDFNNSQVIGHSLKQRLTTIKNAIAGVSPAPQSRDPRNFKYLKDSRDSKDDHDLRTTEEDTIEDDDQSSDNFVTFKAIVESLLQFSDDCKRIEISFLALKLISLSTFKQILDDSQFVKLLLINVLSDRFKDDRLWFNYEPISKHDFEEKIVRIIDQFQRSQAFDRESKRQLADISTSNDYHRIGAYMIEITRGTIDAYHHYIDSLRDSQPGHLFAWLKKKIIETVNIDKKAELCFEVMKDMRLLVD